MTSNPTSASVAAAAHVIDAQRVLDQTRRELVDFLVGEPAAAKVSKSTKTNAGATRLRGDAQQQRASAPRGKVDSIDWMGLMKAGVATWWRGHPLHLGAVVLQPVISGYVRRKPVATLSVAAAAGALLVVIRPWRIASVTALGMSLVRSSNLSVMAASLVATVAEKLQKEHS